MVEIGNFQINGSSQQKDSRFTYDIFTDTGSLSRARAGTYKILNLFGFTSWSQIAIKTKFSIAEQYASQVNGLVWIGEEWYKPSRTPQINPATAQGNYTLEGINIPSPSNEDDFILALLRAWKNMCNRLGKDAWICGSPAVCSDDAVWPWMYGNAAIPYMATNYNMILYHYPTTLSAAQGTTCKQQNGNPGKNDAASYIKFWKGKGVKKIIYNLTTKFPNSPGTTDINVIRADFKSAADAGANIISTYPYANGISSDGSAASRLIEILNWYNGGTNTPTPQPHQLTVSISSFPETATIKVNNQNIYLIKKG